MLEKSTSQANDILLAYMACWGLTHSAISIQSETFRHWSIHPCGWQVEVSRWLLERQSNLIMISGTGSGKTLTFWMPMLYETAITIIITPLKALGAQMAKESEECGFRAMNVTAELMGSCQHLVNVCMPCHCLIMLLLMKL